MRQPGGRVCRSLSCGSVRCGTLPEDPVARQQDAGRDREAQRKPMSFNTWELKDLRDPGAPEWVREL